jgi:sec-independent protein translocase protein TatA
VEFSPWHLVILAVVAAILFFGWKQLPDMARSAGRSLRVFRTELKGMTDDDAAREAKRRNTEAVTQATADTPAAQAPAVAPAQPPAASAQAADVPVNDGHGPAAG